jgi:thioredoxin 1
MSVAHVESEEQFIELLKNPWVVVDFSAEWCPPCRRFEPIFQAMSLEFVDVVFAAVNIDRFADMLEVKSVKAVPTFMLFQNGTAIDKVEGASEAKVRQMLSKASL